MKSYQQHFKTVDLASLIMQARSVIMRVCKAFRACQAELYVNESTKSAIKICGAGTRLGLLLGTPTAGALGLATGAAATGHN